ncbi:MAG: hypothetical protein IT376_05490 [Polyangiaceae bacterium]|nr:hypothetical protein [Polyangiaceae bacterium]
MGLTAAAALWAGSLLASPPGGALGVAARAGPPPECAARAPGRGAAGLGAADRSRVRYCAQLATAQARLATAPAESLRAADEAATGRPRAASPQLLAGRALHALGRDADAWERFAAVRAAAFTQESPDALLDLARVALAVGRVEDARAAYRRLAPRAAWLTPRWRRGEAMIEAGLVALAEGPAAVDEALTYLREAERAWAPVGSVSLIAAGLALSLDRAGRGAEARRAVRTASDLPTLERALEPERPWGRRLASLPSERAALVAVVAALRGDPDARERWAEAARAGGPWAEVARARAAGRVP